MQLPKSFTTVTLFSKALALALFFLLPILGFYLGMEYQKLNSSQEKSKPSSITSLPPQKIYYAPTPTITPIYPTSTPTIKPPIIIENWKTFKDEKYNISFKYPEFWYENPYKLDYYNYFFSNYDYTNESVETNRAKCWEMICAELFYKIRLNTSIDIIQNDLNQKVDPLRGEINYDYINGSKIMYYDSGGLRNGSVNVYIQSSENVVEFSFEPDKRNFPKKSWLWFADSNMDIYKKIFESVGQIKN